MRLGSCGCVCLIITALALVSCTQKKAGSLDFGLEIKDTLRINILTEPPTLDWSKSVDTTSSTIELNIMEGLVDYDLRDPHLGPATALATAWKPSEGARVWTFILRKNVRWTDGVLFTGQQVVDGFERVLNPETASEYAYYLFPVKNARAYNSGKLKNFKEVGVRVNHRGDLVIELEQPMGYFPYLLTHHSTFPIRKDVIEKYGDKWTDPTNMQTLGAFKLKAWEHDKAIMLERNENYYGEKAKVKNVLCYMINEFTTALNLLEAGKIDFQPELPAKELPIFRRYPGFRQVNSLQIYYYGFNTKKSPFDNVKVRQAFVQAVDRKQITDLLNAGHVPLSGWVPQAVSGKATQNGLAFDPTNAARLLDEAGFKDRAQFPRVTLAFNTNENHQRIAENVQAQIKKNLGVEIELANEEWKVYLSRVKNNTPDIYRMGWLADYPDPSSFTDLMTSFSDNNHTGWGSKKYDELASQASRSLDKIRRQELYGQLERLLTQEEVPVMPVFSGVRQVLLSERVKNFPITPIERWILKGVSLK